MKKNVYIVLGLIAILILATAYVNIARAEETKTLDLGNVTVQVPVNWPDFGDYPYMPYLHPDSLRTLKVNENIMILFIGTELQNEIDPWLALFYNEVGDKLDLVGLVYKPLGLESKAEEHLLQAETNLAIKVTSDEFFDYMKMLKGN